MQQHRQREIDNLFARLLPLLPSIASCFARDHSLDDRIDSLEMARIRRKRQTDFATVFEYAFARRALVIFHVAFVGGKLRMRPSLQTPRRFARTSCRSTFASTFKRPRWAMPNVDLFDAASRRAVDQSIEQRNDCFAAFE